MNQDVLTFDDIRILGSSHGRSCEYWTHDGLQVYQRNVKTGVSMWFCAMSAWDSTFSKADWILFT